MPSDEAMIIRARLENGSGTRDFQPETCIQGTGGGRSRWVLSLDGFPSLNHASDCCGNDATNLPPLQVLPCVGGADHDIMRFSSFSGTQGNNHLAKPDLFIVGAPKCGTTALYEYLRPHPNIYMSPLKEPHFFATDLGTYPQIKTLADYTGLFDESSAEHLRVGEASVYYLRSATAIANIREFNPGAKLIAMYRNPVDMVHALHSQLLYWSEEIVSDFEAAWRLQGQRANGVNVPATCREPFLLQYGEVGRFGTQTERLLSIFPASQVKLILYDDFAESPAQIYGEVMSFLEIPHDGRTEFPRINDNKRAGVTWLRNFIRKPPPPVRSVYRALKQTVGQESLPAIKQKVVDLNTVKERRAPLSPEFRAELVETFRDEVSRLGRILDRDLSHWT
jgi:hypothetical protein